METIIGIGRAGCSVAEVFKKYGIYDIYKIDEGAPDILNPHSYGLKKQTTHEDYEKNTPDFSDFFSKINSETLVIVCGEGKVSGVTLKALQQLTTRLTSEKVSVLYIRPDTEELSGDSKLQERIVYNVLQQYARSGMIKSMMLVNNPSLEKIVGEVPIRVYFEKLNDLMVSTMHMINIFDHSEPEIKSYFRKSDASRICTLGISNLDHEEEKMFFPLDNKLEMHYYYAINENTLESDGALIKNIKSKMRNINTSEQRGTYGVYSTKYSENYVYLISFSQMIQKSS